MKKSRKFILSLFVLLFTLIFCYGVHAEWVQEGGGWKYKDGDNFIVNDWKELDNSIYYFDANGFMAKGLVKIGNNYHIFDENGRPFKKGKEFEYNDNIYVASSKGKLDEMTEDVYNAYMSEKASEAALKADMEAKAKAEKESREASIAAYKIEHAAEIAEAEAKKKAEDEANAEKAKLKAEEAAAKRELLISSENREKLQSEANKGSSRNVVIRNIVNEVRRQLNERRSSFILQAKTEYKANPANCDIERFSSLFYEVVDEYASVLDNMIDALSVKFDMRQESIDGAVSEISEVLLSAKSKFEEEFNKIGEEEDDE